MDVPTPRRRTLPVAEVTEPFKYSPRFLTVKLRKRVGPVGKRCREEADTYPTGLSCSSSGPRLQRSGGAGNAGNATLDLGFAFQFIVDGLKILDL